jgi:ArsR family metal-binding transcriptional regulator
VSYLDSTALTKTLPCLVEPGKIIVVGKPSRNLDDVLPYLATLPGIIAWNPEACTLTFCRQPGFMTLYSDKVYIT